MWNEWTHKCIKPMDRGILRVPSSCHYWHPPNLQGKLLQPRREIQFGNNQNTGKLTWLSPRSKKRSPYPPGHCTACLSHASGHTLPLSSNSLFQFLKMTGFHTKQDRSSRCQLFFRFLFSSWELNKKHFLWKFIRRVSIGYSHDLLAQHLVPH